MYGVVIDFICANTAYSLQSRWIVAFRIYSPRISETVIQAYIISHSYVITHFETVMVVIPARFNIPGSVVFVCSQQFAEEQTVKVWTNGDIKGETRRVAYTTYSTATDLVYGHLADLNRIKNRISQTRFILSVIPDSKSMSCRKFTIVIF